MANSYVLGSAFLIKQKEVNDRLASKYASGVLAEGRKLEFDKLEEPIFWVKDSADLHLIVKSFKADPIFQMDYLSDLTAYDNKDKKDGPKRFVVVYQLLSTVTHTRVRIKLAVDLNEEVQTLTTEWNTANWFEREVWDMYGIPFKGHPNLRRIMMDERFTGHPLRKEYPIKQREPFSNNIPLHLGANALPSSEVKP